MIMNNSLAAGVLAAGKHSAAVTHIGQRILWTVVTLVVLAGIYLLMWRGWNRRKARQSDVPPLVPIPADFAADHGEDQLVEGIYVSTTSAGDWLDRIAVHGLGNRSKAVIAVDAEGVGVMRSLFGASDFFIPAEAVQGVRLTTGMAGKYLRDEGIVVITWQHGDRVLDTGVKTRLEADRAILVEAVQNIQKTPAPAPASTTATEGHTP